MAAIVRWAAPRSAAHPRIGAESPPAMATKSPRPRRSQIAAAAAGLEARGKEEAQPRPHGVQLPHMAEVAQARESRPAVAKDRACHAQVEARRRETVGPLGDVEPDEPRGQERQPRGRQQRAPPRQVGQAADEMGRSRAHGERAHQDADREPATGLKPRCDDLHRGRVDARHAQARGEAETRAAPGFDKPERPRKRGPRRRSDHEDARRHDVG